MNSDDLSLLITTTSVDGDEYEIIFGCSLSENQVVVLFPWREFLETSLSFEDLDPEEVQELQWQAFLEVRSEFVWVGNRWVHETAWHFGDLFEDYLEIYDSMRSRQKGLLVRYLKEFLESFCERGASIESWLSRWLGRGWMRHQDRGGRFVEGEEAHLAFLLCCCVVISTLDCDEREWSFLEDLSLELELTGLQSFQQLELSKFVVLEQWTIEHQRALLKRPLEERVKILQGQFEGFTIATEYFYLVLDHVEKMEI